MSEQVDKVRCERCDGDGVIDRYRNTGLGADDDNSYEIVCPVCKGTGMRRVQRV